MFQLMWGLWGRVIVLPMSVESSDIRHEIVGKITHRAPHQYVIYGHLLKCSL